MIAVVIDHKCGPNEQHAPVVAGGFEPVTALRIDRDCAAPAEHIAVIELKSLDLVNEILVRLVPDLASLLHGSEHGHPAQPTVVAD